MQCSGRNRPTQGVRPLFACPTQLSDAPYICSDRPPTRWESAAVLPPPPPGFACPSRCAHPRRGIKRGTPPPLRHPATIKPSCGTRHPGMVLSHTHAFAAFAGRTPDPPGRGRHAGSFHIQPAGVGTRPCGRGCHATRAGHSLAACGAGHCHMMSPASVSSRHVSVEAHTRFAVRGRHVQASSAGAHA